MSDPLDQLMHRLRNQAPPAAFAPPAAVRRRGRQRSRRTALAAGAAVLAVGVGTTVVVALPVLRGPDGAPVVAPTVGVSSPAPRPTMVAADVVLQAADLGPGDWRVFDPPLFEGLLWWWNGLCEQSFTPSSLEFQVSVSTVGYRGDGMAHLAVVERYREGQAAAAVADVRTIVRGCRTGEYTVVPGRAVGDEALFVREARPTVPERVVAVVRVGDLVATLIPATGRDQAFTQGLAEKAADRLGG